MEHGQQYRRAVPGLRRSLRYQSLQEGFDVLGGYLSPVNDAYGKPDLAPATHRSYQLHG